jgi:hypothetical protein
MLVVLYVNGAPRRKECPQDEVVQHGHRREQLSLFRNQAYPSLDPLFRFQILDRLSKEFDLAFARLQCRDGVQQGRLTHPVWANNRYDLSFAHDKARGA